MLKRFYNIKISRSTLFLSILAITFNLLVGLVSYHSLNKINNDTNLMYSKSVKQLDVITGIRGAFANIRLNATKCLYKFDPKYNNEIIKNDAIIKDYLDDFSSLTLDEIEAANVRSLKNNYNDYLSLWNTSFLNLSSGQTINNEDYNNIINLASEIEDSLYNFQTESTEQAEQLNNESIAAYKSTILIFIIILLSIIVVFSIISFIILKVLNASSKEIINDIDTLSKGNFSIKLETNRTNEFGKMTNSLAKMIKDLSALFNVIKNNSTSINSQALNLTSTSEEMSHSSEQVTTAIEEISKGITAQSTDLVSMSSTFNKFGEKLNEVVKITADIASNSNTISTMTDNSSADMNKLMHSVYEIKTSFHGVINSVTSFEKNVVKINEITNLINSIADQTNLLALNASIEAARAGDHGRGFAVLAEEIRKLAEKCKDSSEDIYSLVNKLYEDKDILLTNTSSMSTEMKNQITIIDNTINSFKSIIHEISTVKPKIENVTLKVISIDKDKNSIIESIDQISAISEQISASSEQIVSASQEMYASSEEVVSTSEKLSGMTKEMLDHVNKFKL